jgi:hypothetical protein
MHRRLTVNLHVSGSACDVSARIVVVGPLVAPIRPIGQGAVASALTMSRHHRTSSTRIHGRREAKFSVSGVAGRGGDGGAVAALRA